jgi:integrase
MGHLFRPKYTDRQGRRHASATWCVKFYSNGRRITESAKTTDHAEAKQYLKRREGEVAKGAPILPGQQSIRFKVLAEDVQRDYRINNRRSTRDVDCRLRLHILPAFGDLKASSINAATIRAFTDRRQEEDASNAEINRELAIIRRAFSLAVESGRVFHKPFIPMLKEASPRTGFFEPEQFLGVLKHLPEHVQALASFAYLTGWRRDEVLSLTWPQVDFEYRTVRLYTSKNDEGREFPFTPDLEAVLRRQKAKADELKRRGIITPWVFNHQDGKPIREFKRSWRTACRKAGVPGRMFHDFRRTAVRNLERAGVPRTIAMKLTGHKTESVYRRYDIVSQNDLEVAAQRLGEYTRSLLQGGGQR